MSKDDLRASQRSSSPTRLPRYVDPSQKKYMSAVKKDLNYFKMTGKRKGSQPLSACSNHRDSVELASVKERDDVNLASQTINIKKTGVSFEESPKKNAGPNLSRTQKTIKRFASSQHEDLEVMMTTQPPIGRQKAPIVRASLVVKTRD